jgi:hypothetical protein
MIEGIWPKAIFLLKPEDTCAQSDDYNEETGQWKHCLLQHASHIFGGGCWTTIYSKKHQAFLEEMVQTIESLSLNKRRGWAGETTKSFIWNTTMM